MALYKFLRHNDVRFLINHGSVQFGRLQYFQLLEEVTGDEFIGDINEATATTKVTTVVDGSSPTFQHNPLKGLMSGPGKMAFQDCNFIQYTDCFVLCLADGEFAPLLAAMSKTRNGKLGYDACLEVNLPNLISQLENVSHEGRPLSDQFEIKVGKVSYLSTLQRDFGTTGTVVPGDPFEKLEKYSEQQEYRLVLLPRVSVVIEHDHLRLKIADPAEVFSEVPTGKLFSYPIDAPGDFDDLYSKAVKWVEGFGSSPFYNVPNGPDAYKQFVEYYWALRELTGKSELVLDMAIKFEGRTIESIIRYFESYLRSLKVRTVT